MFTNTLNQIFRTKEAEAVVHSVPGVSAYDIIERSRSNRKGFISHFKYLLRSSNNHPLIKLFDREAHYQSDGAADLHYAWAGVYWLITHRIRSLPGQSPIVVDKNRVNEVLNEEAAALVGEITPDRFKCAYLAELILISRADIEQSEELRVFWEEFRNDYDNRGISPRPVLAFIRLIHRATDDKNVRQ